MKTKSNQIRYATYARCSTDEQAKGDFTTIDSQQATTKRYVLEKGGVLVKEYMDEARKGLHLNRPTVQQMFKDAAAGLFDVVVVTFMHRLGRGDAFVNARYELAKHKVTIELVKEKFGNDLAGYYQEKCTNMVDGAQPRQTSLATKAKQEEMVRRGYFMGGNVPFGYRTERAIHSDLVNVEKEPPKNLVPHSINGELVTQAYDLYRECRSIANVRNYLNSVSERKWTTTTVKALLTNELYKGNLSFGQWRNDGSQPALVRPDVWEAVQENLAERQAGRPPRDDYDDYSYYLRGRIRCPHCGTSYTQASAWGRNGRVHYYVCLAGNKYNAPCPVKRINADRLHHTALYQLEYTAKHLTVMHKLIAQSGGWGGPNEMQRSLRGQLAKKKQFLDLRAANYLQAIAEGRALTALLPALEQVETEKIAVRDELARVDREIALATVKRPTAEQVSEVWGQVGELWDELTEDERVELLGGIVQGVEVTDKNRVLLKLSPVAEVHGSWFAIKSRMGAVDGLSSIYPSEPLAFETVRFRFQALKGGRNRTKVPRPERRNCGVK